MNDRLLTLNIIWLFFIVTLPFTTSVLSTHFGDSPAIFLYSLNVFMVTTLQGLIWYYAIIRKTFTDDPGLGNLLKKRFQLMCNLDIINAFIAVVLSFFHPTLAFILLFTKVPVLMIATLYIARERRKELMKRRK